jgi:hypothetical protein
MTSVKTAAETRLIGARMADTEFWVWAAHRETIDAAIDRDAFSEVSADLAAGRAGSRSKVDVLSVRFVCSG